MANKKFDLEFMIEAARVVLANKEVFKKPGSYKAMEIAEKETNFSWITIKRWLSGKNRNSPKFFAIIEMVEKGWSNEEILNHFKVGAKLPRKDGKGRPEEVRALSMEKAMTIKKYFENTGLKMKDVFEFFKSKPGYEGIQYNDVTDIINERGKYENLQKEYDKMVIQQVYPNGVPRKKSGRGRPKLKEFTISIDIEFGSKSVQTFVIVKAKDEEQAKEKALKSVQKQIKFKIK